MPILGGSAVIASMQDSLSTMQSDESTDARGGGMSSIGVDDHGHRERRNGKGESRRRLSLKDSRRASAIELLSQVRSSIDARKSHELAMSMDPERRREKAASRIQLCARAHILCKYKRLHRENLAERLLFEANLSIDAWRLVNEVMVFALLIIAMGMGVDPVTKRGIYTNLDEAFGLEDLQGVRDRTTFVGTHLPAISGSAKNYFPLSTSKYYIREGGEVLLLRDVTTFASPKLLPGLELSIQQPAFSFTAIVKTLPQFTSGYILRKRMVDAGPGSELSCFGWFLSSERGPELHYGGHDYFPTYKTETIVQSNQEEVVISNASAFEPDRFQLLTLVVNNSDVTFYQGTQMLGTTRMLRPVTDCFNNLEGMLVGETGMSLGQLIFFPKPLSSTLIEEIYIGGGTLEDIAKGSSAPPLAKSEIVEMSQGLEAKLDTVNKSVWQQQELAEVLMVMQDTGNASSSKKGSMSPSLKTGRIAINRTVQDTANPERVYHSLLFGPWKLDQAPIANDASFAGERYWHSDDFPSFSGRGVSFTSWFRNVDCPEGKSCGSFLLSAHPDKTSSSRCWSAWLETNGIYWDALGGTPGFGYPVNEDLNEYYTDQFKMRSDTWRHVAFVFNEDNDHIEFFLDGILAFSRYFGKSVKSMSDGECASVNVSTGFRWPGYTYGASIEVYDLRMYVGVPLSEAEIYKLATAQVRAPPSFVGDDQERVRSDRCLFLTDPAMKDTTWKDAYGHDCGWYYLRKPEFPTVCQHSEVRKQCPIACKSEQECFQVGSFNRYFAWNSIRRIEPKSSNGSICLGSNLGINQTVAACNEWMGQIDTDQTVWQWREDVDQRQPGFSRVNLTECQTLAEAIDPFCEFDSSQVEQFTEEMKGNGGDFTLAFWVKPIGSQSLDPNGRFIPSVHFLSSVSPPFSNVAFGPFVSGNNGEVRTRSGCTDTRRVISEEIEFSVAPSETDWTFVAVTKNNKGISTGTASATVAINSAETTESQGSWELCLKDPKALFTAIEVNKAMLMSPVMMVPLALPFGAVQELYYESVGPMKIRRGPLESTSQRATRFEVSKEDYVEKSVLMATPIIFQMRAAPSATCPYEFSTNFLARQQENAAEQCQAPLVCPDAASQATMACPGEVIEGENVFGLVPQLFSGTVGYADFLFSITDQAFVFRDGQLFPTASFVDSLTQSVKIILVFFTPQYGITSVLTVDADMSQSVSVAIEVRVQHFAILEGFQLLGYVIVQSLVLISVFLKVLDVVCVIRDFTSHYRQDGVLPTLAAFTVLCIDLISIIVTVAGVAVRIPAKLRSADVVDRTLGNLSRIPWTSSTIPVSEKKSVFFKNVQDLLSNIAQEQTVDDFLNIVLITTLIRVIQCTKLHPRLAVLTGTIIHAMDDFWHSAVLILLIMGSFAGIGTWRFGSEFELFGTWELSMQTLFMLTLGHFDDVDFWGTRSDLAAFFVLYILVMFLLVLNFLLAIVVEAYLQVRRRIDVCETEMEFFTDMAYTINGSVLRRRHGWPKRRLLGIAIEQYKMLNIGFMELWNTGLFEEQKSLQTFLEYYGNFVFLEPCKITKYGTQRAEDEMKHVIEIEKRVARLLGMRIPTVREQALLERPDLSDPETPLTPAMLKANTSSKWNAARHRSVELSGKWGATLAQLVTTQLHEASRPDQGGTEEGGAVAAAPAAQRSGAGVGTVQADDPGTAVGDGAGVGGASWGVVQDSKVPSSSFSSRSRKESIGSIERKLRPPATPPSSGSSQDSKNGEDEGKVTTTSTVI